MHYCYNTLIATSKGSVTHLPRVKHDVPFLKSLHSFQPQLEPLLVIRQGDQAISKSISQ